VDSKKFSELAIKPSILKNLSTLGYKSMTPIQEKALGPVLAGKDILAQAKTGSGKTAAFGIGLLSQLDPTKKEIQSLVICPTRELAEQVAKEIRRLARQMTNVKVVTLCGGSPLGAQAASLEHGAHCIVGTPGRIEDHLGRKTLRLGRIKTLVLDEADRMLDMGFSEVLDYIVSRTPEQRQTLLFSATYPENIQSLSKKYQKEAISVRIESTKESLKIEETFFEIDEEHKENLLVNLLHENRPESTVIFCQTKQKCHELALYLKKKDFSALAIHGDLEQRERSEVLALFSHKSVSILVATDVAARGLDIKNLTAVVNYDISRDPEVHVHRIGRTGRAGKEGLAWTFYTKREKHRVKAIEEYQDKKALVAPAKEYKDISSKTFYPPMVSFCIAGGKKSKLRPTDILGALTVSKELSGSDVGKIDIFDFHSFVAIKQEKAKKAFDILAEGKIKGRFFKVRKAS